MSAAKRNTLAIEQRSGLQQRERIVDVDERVCFTEQRASEFEQRSP